MCFSCLNEGIKKLIQLKREKKKRIFRLTKAPLLSYYEHDYCYLSDATQTDLVDGSGVGDGD